eukprot:gene15951-21644_t
MDLNVKVAVRCRPMSSKEITRGCVNVVEIVSNSIRIKTSDKDHEDKDFTFDYCYDSSISQQDVYKDLGEPIVNQAMEGFNGTIFAYGQTGSGKTFSMMGTEDNKGIIPQLNDNLWNKIASVLNIGNQPKGCTTKFMVTVSFLEVYNEEIKDLLNPSDKKLTIHENPQKGIYVQDLCELIVRDSNDVMKLISQGNTVRRVASTNMNDQSSRSHSVFTIRIEQKNTTELPGGLTREQTIRAKVNLVDLAGSERASKTGASGATLKEGANINLSLMTLGNVINSLSEGKKKGAKKVIPYRDSKLTRLLQESLGGNAATVMIASISPADYNYSETIGTLKYANRAKSIANAVTRNENSSERMIRDLQAQIEELKKKLESEAVNGDNKHHDPELEVKLKEMEEEQKNAWEERERLSKELEAARQHNMNTVISNMMLSVKEQKVQRMKNIKRLTNEKALLTKNYKEYKDENVDLKSSLDSSIQKYQQLQKEYDDLMISEENEQEMKDDMPAQTPSPEKLLIQQKKNETAELMANQMVSLLTKIETERLKFTEKRDALKRMRTRLEQVEEEITDERAELVATAGLLSQNDKLREQIQEEEREKMKTTFEAEINK